jgi:hypothetical protein
MNLIPLHNLYSRGFFQIRIEDTLESVNGQLTIPTQGLECLTFKYPFLEPNESICQTLLRIITREEYTAILTLKSLLAQPYAPPNNS